MSEGLTGALRDLTEPSVRIAGRAPKILTLDIENSPNLAYVWDLWEQTVSPTNGQLLEARSVISFAAKWYGQRKVEFYSDFHDGHDEMLAQAHRLLCEADIVVHYNGLAFDMKHLRTQFALAGMAPHSPVREVDLYRVVRARFKFPSNKLDYVAQVLELGGKASTGGFQLWRDCLDGDELAWAKMRRYNKQDVVLTEKLYDRLRPWIPNHPHLGLYAGEERACDKCGSTDLKPAGLNTTAVTRYAQYQCQVCGGFSRMNHRKASASMRGVR